MFLAKCGREATKNLFFDPRKASIFASRQCKAYYTKMVRPKVLVTRPDIPDVAMNILRQHCDIITWMKPEPIPHSELLSMVPGINGLYCVLTDKINEEVLSAAGTNLEVVATMSVGLDHLDLKALKQRSIRVGYTPGILTDATAELAIALLLATSRRLLEANKSIHKNEWKSWAPTWMCGPSLSGSTVGIVGLGRIGIRVGEYLKGFNVAKILYTSRTPKSEASKFSGHKVELDELLRESDFVIVTIALVPETKGMFNAQTFGKMKKTATFINISRGDIVDQDALIQALKNGTIRAAGLDVMVPEPITADHELLKLDNCVVLPHIGSATIETREKMAIITAENIVAVLTNTPGKMPAPFVW